MVEPAQLLSKSEPSADDGREPTRRSLGDSLIEVRLAHRHERLRLVLHALELRRRALVASGTPIPAALMAAVRGFQRELADVSALRQQYSQADAARTRSDDERRAVNVR